MPPSVAENTSLIDVSSYYTAVGMAGLFAFLFMFVAIIALILVVAIMIIRKKTNNYTSVEDFASDMDPNQQQGKLLVVR